MVHMLWTAVVRGSSLAAAHLPHNAVLGAAGQRGVGEPAGPRPRFSLAAPARSTAWPCRAAHQLGRAQSTPLRLRLRSGPARLVWRAFLSPAPARLRCSVRRAPSRCRSQPSRTTLVRSAVPVLLGDPVRLCCRLRPLAGGERPPCCARLARALNRRRFRRPNPERNGVPVLAGTPFPLRKTTMFAGTAQDALAWATRAVTTLTICS